MNKDIERVRNWFNKIYLGGIPLMMKNETAFLSFICVLAGTEALAGYRYKETGETREPGERFRRFVQTYFPPEYNKIAPTLWNFRNGMIHGFCPRCFTLTEHQNHLHLKKTTAGAIVLNAEDFYCALVSASKRYFIELETSKELEANFLARLHSSQGGNVAVGPIVVT